jgi:bifunctional UDP-N-acetylglucosamine pyrophosphorylase/glucosamine-1-phosphate N-acetyltransferase
VIHDAHGDVLDVVEQKSGSPEQLAIREANMGIYCFRADLSGSTLRRSSPTTPQVNTT